jgi:hypothetical protein
MEPKRGWLVGAKKGLKTTEVWSAEIRSEQEEGDKVPTVCGSQSKNKSATKDSPEETVGCWITSEEESTLERKEGETAALPKETCLGPQKVERRWIERPRRLSEHSTTEVEEVASTKVREASNKKRTLRQERKSATRIRGVQSNNKENQVTFLHTT